MKSSEIQILINRAEESHQAARILLEGGFSNFSAAQSYYRMFYLVEALLHSKGLTFSSHSAVIAAFGKEFAKTAILDPDFHRRASPCDWSLWGRKQCNIRRCTRVF